MTVREEIREYVKQWTSMPATELLDGIEKLIGLSLVTFGVFYLIPALFL